MVKCTIESLICQTFSEHTFLIFLISTLKSKFYIQEIRQFLTVLSNHSLIFEM
jgi:hypothetical protein